MAQNSTIEYEHDFIFKLILIGDDSVGKTSLLHRAVNDEFSFRVGSTLGVDFYIKQFVINGKKIKAQVWDTNGTDRFKVLTRLYYHNVQGAFVVFDLTDSTTFDSTAEWVEELHKYGHKDVFITLIGNKSDLTSRRQVTYEQAIALAEKLGFLYVETSAFNSSNVEQMFILLIRSILHNTTQVMNTQLSHPINIVTVSSGSSEQVSNDKTRVSCNICASNESTAIMSCDGCAQHFCQKHLDGHQEQLKKDLNKIINAYEEILQDFQMEMSHPSNPCDNDDARTLLKQIDEWQTKTIDACYRTADEARGIVARLFSKKKEKTNLKKKIETLRKEITEQKQSEKFMESDLERLKEKVEALKHDMEQLMTLSEPITLQTQSINWWKILNISRPSNTDQILNHYVLVTGAIGAGMYALCNYYNTYYNVLCLLGKSTIIDYIANYFADRHEFNKRILRITENPSYALVTTNIETCVQTTMTNYYRFPINDRENILFIETINFDNDDKIPSNDIPVDCLDIDRFTAIIIGIDGKNFDETNLLSEITAYTGNTNSSVTELFPQLFVIVTHCRSCNLKFDSSKFKLPGNINIYGMENSAYSSSDQAQAQDRVENDFLASRKTIEQILNNLLDGSDQHHHIAT
ncbi:unnamed protein product [Rotaria sp. Silwood2]|nr:unnamed protein product [Rotaria sp. Silwood2]